MCDLKASWVLRGCCSLPVWRSPVLDPAGRSPAGGGWNHGGDPMQMAIARLNLAGEQQTKVQAVSDQETAKIAALREQIRPAHDALDAAAQAEKPDPAAVGKAYLNARAAEQAVQTEVGEVPRRRCRSPHAGAEDAVRGVSQQREGEPHALGRPARRSAADQVSRAGSRVSSGAPRPLGGRGFVPSTILGRGAGRRTLSGRRPAPCRFLPTA